MVEFLRKSLSRRLFALRSAREKLQPSQKQCNNSVWAPKEELKHVPFSTSSSLTNGRREHCTRR